VEDVSACQVSNTLRVLALQRREADYVKRREDVQQMGRHTEGQDLVLQAVVLKILVEVALMAVQDEQPAPPYLVHLHMPVKVPQSL
jgi:hypothetical protein